MSRNILVTGASRGIGRAIAERLIDQGKTVVGLARNFDREHPLTAATFHPVTVDLSALGKLPDHLTQLTRTYPDIDTVVCNAGQGHFGHLEEYSYTQIHEFFELNLIAHTYVVRAFLPGMKQRGQGSVIFIGSEAGLAGKQKGTLYCASKFALRGFAQALREECAASNVRVSIVNPGMVKTNFFDTLNFGPGDNPTNYLLPEDVAEAVSMILSRHDEMVVDELNLSPLKKTIQFKKK